MNGGLRISSQYKSMKPIAESFKLTRFSRFRYKGCGYDLLTTLNLAIIVGCTPDLREPVKASSNLGFRMNVKTAGLSLQALKLYRTCYTNALAYRITKPSVLLPKAMDCRISTPVRFRNMLA
jgi:hypothetical protein